MSNRIRDDKVHTYDVYSMMKIDYIDVICILFYSLVMSSVVLAGVHPGWSDVRQSD